MNPLHREADTIRVVDRPAGADAASSGERDVCPTALRVVVAGSGSEILSRITVLLTSRAVTTLSLCAACDRAAGVTLVHLVVECVPTRTPLLCRQLERLVQVSSVEVLQLAYTDDVLDLAHCGLYGRDRTGLRIDRLHGGTDHSRP